MELKKMKIRIVSPKRKNPRLAALASLFFAGLGQVYNGDIVEGSAFVCIQVINICSRLLSRIPVALAAGGMRNLNNPCYYEIHTKAINTFV